MSDLLASMFTFLLVGCLIALATDFALGLVHLWAKCGSTINKPLVKFDNHWLTNQLPNARLATLDWVQPVSEEEVEIVDIIALAKARLPKFDITTLKLYKLRGETVVRIADIPFNIPAAIKRYKLRGMDVIKLAALQTITVG